MVIIRNFGVVKGNETRATLLGGLKGQETLQIRSRTTSTMSVVAV